MHLMDRERIKKQFHWRLAIALLGTAMPFQFANADSDGEREMLARINHELNVLDPLIDQAVSQANPDARIQFQYDWLRQDLHRLQMGIQDHINAPRAEPRTFPPLRGDYRR